jgi:hypothetical protein
MAWQEHSFDRTMTALVHCFFLGGVVFGETGMCCHGDGCIVVAGNRILRQDFLVFFAACIRTTIRMLCCCKDIIFFILVYSLYQKKIQ